MNEAVYEQISTDENFIELTKERRKITWILTFIICFVYFAFILLIAFFPSFLSYRIFDSHITIGMPFGISIIFLCFLLTGIYIKKANDTFDRLTEKIKKNLQNSKNLGE